MRPLRVALASVAAACVVGLSARAEAQTQGRAASVLAGSGLSIGGSGGNTVMLPSPVMIDAGASFWNSERPELVYGIGARVELTGRTSIAALPRVALHREAGPIAVRPYLALPLFVAPFSLFGVEGAVEARLPLWDRSWLVARVMIDGFFFGSDLPSGAALVMVNGAVGVEMEL